jgi:hypothetical protein
MFRAGLVPDFLFQELVQALDGKRLSYGKPPDVKKAPREGRLVVYCVCLKSLSIHRRLFCRSF